MTVTNGVARGIDIYLRANSRSQPQTYGVGGSHAPDHLSQSLYCPAGASEVFGG